MMDYFRTKFWSEIGNDIRGLIIVVAEGENFEAVKEFLDDEGIVNCYLSESTLHEIASKRRRQLKEILRNFRENISRVIVVSERLLWYQRIRISGGKHVLFYGAPKTASIYEDILADISDPSRCNSVCMYTNDDALEIERIVGTKNIEKLIVADPNVQVTAKSTVFTP
jgi:hypothetical protein